MAYRKVDTLVIRDAHIIYRHFSGEKTQNNRYGKRNFGVVLDYETAQLLKNDGWNVKPLKHNGEISVDDNGNPINFLSVEFAFDKYPPTIKMITSKKITRLTEETVMSLDRASIKSADISIRPYCWENDAGETGIKAYLQTLNAFINEDPLALEYPETDEEISE